MESPTRPATALLEGGMAVAVVGRPFLRVAQGLVGFAQFLEPVLRRVVPGVFVRVKLDREAAVGFFDLLVRRRTLDFEHFVIVALARHSAPFETKTLAGRISRSRSL
jgi:hypothetical protein